MMFGGLGRWLEPAPPQAKAFTLAALAGQLDQLDRADRLGVGVCVRAARESPVILLDVLEDSARLRAGRLPGIAPDEVTRWLAAGACGAGLGSELYRAGDTPDSVFSKARAVVEALGQVRSA